MKYYPAFLDLKGKRVLLVGGGRIALEKVGALARCGARISVVAPVISPLLRRKAERVALRSFRPADLQGVFLVISATDDPAINSKVAGLCRSRGIWVNVVDRPSLCDFIAPAVVRRGEITVAISTGGASPGLAKHLRRKCEEFLRPEFVRLASRLKRMRPELLTMPMPDRRKVLYRLIEAHGNS